MSDTKLTKFKVVPRVSGGFIVELFDENETEEPRQFLGEEGWPMSHEFQAMKFGSETEARREAEAQHYTEISKSEITASC